MRRAFVLLLAAAFISSMEAAEILLYDENSIQQNAQAGLTSLGLSFTLADAGNFDTLLTGSTWDLVILDVPSTPPVGGFSSLESYIAGGGRALMSFWTLQTVPTLAAAFEVAQVSTFSSPQDVNIWNAAHPIFNSPNSVGPLTSWSDLWADDGDRLDPVGSAVALGGFSPAPAAGEAAIILGNSGRTLYNGFLWDEFADQNGVDFIANEVEFLLGEQTVSQVPEPSTFLLLGSALLALVGARFSTNRAPSCKSKAPTSQRLP